MKIEDVINKDTITSVIAVFGLIAVYYQVQQSNKCSLFEKRLNIYSFYKELYDSWISCEMWNDSLDLFIKNQNMPAQAIFLDLTNTVSLYDLCDYFPLDKIDYSKQKEFRKRVAELRNISNSVKFLFKEKIFGIPFEFLDNYVSLLDILYRYQFGVIRRKEITETYNSMPYSKEVEEAMINDSKKVMQELSRMSAQIENKHINEKMENEIRLQTNIIQKIKTRRGKWKN